MADLAIIIVSYNVAELLRACLHSLTMATLSASVPVEIVVVDNASTDHSAALVITEFPHVTLLNSPINLGFARANNLGLRHLGFGQSHRPPPKAVMLLNPDTVVQPDLLLELLQVLDSRPEVVVVGPQLRYRDGTLQATRRCFPTMATLFWESTLLEQWWPHNPWARRYRMEELSADQPQTVDWLVGAALLVRWSAIEQAGLLDEDFFMYSEELEWQQRIRHMTGGEIVYYPTTVITHYEGKSSEQNLGQRLINFNRSKLHYARQQFGPRLAWLLARFLQLTFIMQLSIESAKWLLGHKRSLRARRVGQYARVLRELP